jgi:sarcosine oxidase delta subunit
MISRLGRSQQLSPAERVEVKARRTRRQALEPTRHTAAPSYDNVVHDTITSQLSTLTTHMKLLADLVAVMVASSSRPSNACDQRHTVICPYCNKRRHTEDTCYQRQYDFKCDADDLASTENVVFVGLEPSAPPITRALWALP